MAYWCRFRACVLIGCITICCLFILFHVSSIPSWGWGMGGGRQTQGYFSQEVLVRYHSEASTNDINNTYVNLGLNEVGYSAYSGLRRVRVPSNSNVYAVSANLNQNPLVALAEPNYVRRVNFIPNDPLYKLQWHLYNPMLQQTWDQSLGTNVVVAVFDTGVAYRNGGGFALAPDLAETSFMPGYDFVNDDAYPDDDNRHGTHIAGIIAQSTNNLIGGAGVAPECILMPVKVLDHTGSGTVADIVDAIYFAVNNGARVINMSYGFVTSPSSSEEEAINFAVSQGVVVICSAGNESTSEPHYPSSYDAAISVSATRFDHSFADSYSNYGPDVDICAPGGDLDEDVNGDGYPDGIYQQTHTGIDVKDFDFYFAEGTSCSCAFVSGVAALMLARSARPLTPSEVRDILCTTASDLGDPGWDQWYGWGLVNPLAATQAAGTYATASIFGTRTGFQPVTSRIVPSAVYQGSSLPVGVNVPEDRIYQSNAGFLSAVQAGIQAFQPSVSQQSSSTLQGYLATNGRSLFYPSVAGANSFVPSYGLTPMFAAQGLSTIGQQAFSGWGYAQANAGGYQVESSIASTASPYASQSRWSSPISPYQLFPLAYALSLLNGYGFWVR